MESFTQYTRTPTRSGSVEGVSGPGKASKVALSTGTPLLLLLPATGLNTRGPPLLPPSEEFQTAGAAAGVATAVFAGGISAAAYASLETGADE